MRKFIKILYLSLALLLQTLSTVPSSTDNKLYNLMQEETRESLYIMKQFNVNILNRESIINYPVIFPINPKNIVCISGFFGIRLHPIYKIKHFHRGIDIAAVKGTPVAATGIGKVTSAERIPSYGKQITIVHGDNYSTRYAHLDKIFVNVDDTVNLGEVIGLVGSSGISTGNHLHYEILYKGINIDPFSIYDIQEETYRDYLTNVNNHYMHCYGLMSNI